MCVCVFPSAMSLKWHANFKYIAMLDMSELVQTKTIYDFLWARSVILSNVRTDYDLTEF